jgi:hypothetical protein
MGRHLVRFERNCLIRHYTAPPWSLPTNCSSNGDIDRGCTIKLTACQWLARYSLFAPSISPTKQTQSRDRHMYEKTFARSSRSFHTRMQICSRSKNFHSPFMCIVRSYSHPELPGCASVPRGRNPCSGVETPVRGTHVYYLRGGAHMRVATIYRLLLIGG